jgi:DNA mismatch repair protein MSH5
MSACVNMESRISVGCLGAVITWIQRKRASEYLQDDPSADLAYRVLEVKMFSLKGTMMINPDTLMSLQIIQPESHPNAFNQGPGTSGSKESLSIYGLFHHLARTPQGRARLRQYFLRPSLDLASINARLNFVSVFVQPENSIALEKLSKSMSRIKNMRTTSAMLHRGVSGGNKKLGGFKGGVWASLLEFSYHTIDIAETLKEVLGAEMIPLRARAMDILDTFQLQRIGKMVHDVVDLESSIEQHRTVAKRGVDDRLDEIKNVYDGMEELLSQVAIEIGRDIPAFINLNVIYFPQLGFHITVPMNEETGQAVYDGGAKRWQRMFTTENQVYFKDARMREMDEQLGDLYAMICDIEIEISYELAQKVLQDERLLIEASDICAELDALLALARGAVQYKLTRPRLTEDNIIDVKAGRHLLQEMCVASYVPNDTYIVGGDRQTEPASPEPAQEPADGPSMLLLTGPNYSGKSVYMKSIALIVYMAHVGCFVPCASATIGVTDKILTRITTRETVSKNQSAFMIELQQVTMAITQCTRRSLLVIDEFGKGTESCDGAGLTSGVIRYLLDKADEERAKCLVATHFHEIFEVDDGLPELESYPHLGLRQMEVLVDQKQQHEMGQHDSQVTYLYTLVEGRSILSYGTQCAAMNGIPPNVVRRAAHLADLSVKGEDLVRVCAAITDEEEREFHEAEDAAREFLMMDLREGREESLVDCLSSILARETESADTGEQRSDRSDTVSSVAS